jgi:hypothetical protein
MLPDILLTLPDKIIETPDEIWFSSLTQDFDEIMVRIVVLK